MPALAFKLKLKRILKQNMVSILASAGAEYDVNSKI